MVKSDQSSDLESFISFLFDGLEGYAYLAACDRKLTREDEGFWTQQFFEYPAQREYLINTIERVNGVYDIYLAPALYSIEDAHREYVKVTNVVWTEFDGAAPDWSKTNAGIGIPSYRIQSGLQGHEHVYWKLREPLEGADAIEQVTERITFNFRADSSAWDATQVLRPPDTVNHKRGGLAVRSIDYNSVLYDLSVFDVLAPPPPRAEINWKVGSLPEVQDVLLSYALGPDIQRLLKIPVDEVKDRSAGLMQLAYACCQLGMSDNEVFVLVRHLDSKWKKFTDRLDREKRLAQIVTIARNKYPESEKPEVTLLLQFQYQDFMDTEIEIDWVVEGMLMDRGSMLMTGPGGVGKTQISLQFAKHIALGKNYLHYKIGSPKKVAFISLEMGHPDLQIFLRAQDATLTASERALLQENLTIFPIGESWSMNTPVGQQLLVDRLELNEWVGVFTDSVGSAILGNINSQEVVQTYVNFVDRIRNKYGIFWWAIHHNRKKQPGQGHSTQDDVYGDQYLVNRATAVYSVLPGESGLLRVSNFKNRMSKKEKPYGLHRTENLDFTLVGSDEAPEELSSKPGRLPEIDTNDGMSPL